MDGSYELVHEGASIKFGVPFNEINRVFFGIGLEKYHFDPGSNGTTTTVDGTTYRHRRVPQSYSDYFGLQPGRQHRRGRPSCTKAGVRGVWGAFRRQWAGRATTATARWYHQSAGLSGPTWRSASAATCAT